MDARGILFSLEAILRLHSKKEVLSKKDHKTVELALVQIKLLEDEFGAYGFGFEVLKEAKKRKLNLKFFEDDVKKREKHFVKALKKQSSIMKKIEKSLEKVKWPDAKNHVPWALKKEIKRIHKKTDSKLRPLMEKEKYGHEEIEEGLHEFRRMLRWVALYFQAYSPLFSLKQSKSKGAKEKSLVKSYKNNPFCVLGEGSVKVEAQAFYELSDLIVKTGTLKDEGVLSMAIAESLNKTYKSKDLESRTKKIYEVYEKSKVLKRLRKNL